MSSDHTRAQSTGIESVVVRDEVVRRMGEWTSSDAVEVRVHRGKAVLDLRAIGAARSVTVVAQVVRGVLTLLVNDETRLVADPLSWHGRGRLRDHQARGNESGPSVLLSGVVENGQVRVHRGGVGMWFALFSRAHLNQMRRDHERPTRTTA